MKNIYQPLPDDGNIMSRIEVTGAYGCITIQEYQFMKDHMRSNSGDAWGVLPYVTELERKLCDSIAKKLKFNKFFRGSRAGRKSGFFCASNTLKEDAVRVALYYKP